jgi:RecG-like helicase/REP element-mobilizing transposase RayT
MEVSQPLEELDWIPRPKILALRRLGITTAEHLLTHFPRRHEDRSVFPEFPREESDKPICLCGIVTKTSFRRFGGRRIFEATLQEPNANALSQPLTLRWFNLHYIQKMIATDQQLVVYGKPKLRGKRLCMDHPEFEVIEDDEDKSVHLRRITPVYPATEGLSQRVLRSTIYRILQDLDTSSIEPLLPQKLKNGDRGEAIRAIHFPETWQARDAAREHLVLSEFFAMQMLIASRRIEAHARVSAAHCGRGELMERFLCALPFELTAAQKKVIAEIRRDMESKYPMNRLLQGDVGSGKTVVAIVAILLAVEAGYQAAFMAPTQILAEQHYGVLRRWLEPLGVKLSIRTAARQEESGSLPLFDRANDLGSARVSRNLGSAGGPPASSGGSPDEQATRYSKRHLPHFERPWAKYAITFATRKRRTLSAEARQIVLDCILHWHEKRYELFAACVMPDHVHLLIEPGIRDTDAQGNSVFYSLSEILHTIKSFTAHEIAKQEKTTGTIWETESFDRLIRSERDLQEKFDYIISNPWKSGIAEAENDYQWVWFAGIEDTKEFAASRREQQASGLCSPERPDIIIGTHALLYEKVSFSNLGLVVIDEQHKFGVAQRARLTSREPAPDVLVMTATPIPRTITMTVYGDLDVSTLDEMPSGRGKIVTAVRDSAKLGEVLAFLRKQLEAGRQL